MSFDSVKIMRIEDTNHDGWPPRRSVDLKVEGRLHPRVEPYKVDVRNNTILNLGDYPDQAAAVVELVKKCHGEPALAKMIERMEVYGRIVRVCFDETSDVDYALDLLMPIIVRILRIMEAVRLSRNPLEVPL